MPEKFDFSKIEDQQKFESLPEEKKDEIKEDAEWCAYRENYDRKVQSLLALFGADRKSISQNPEVQKRLRDTENFLATLSEREFLTNDTPYSEQFQRFLESEKGEEAFKILEKKLENKIVIDLGSGVRNHVMELLSKINVRGYIGVDRFPESYERTKRNAEACKKIMAVAIKDDMLHFVASLPDNSVNYVMNGIDWHVIHHDEYWERLSKEIYRSTEKQGIVTGYETHRDTLDYRDEIEGMLFKNITPELILNITPEFVPSYYSKCFILEKIGKDERTV